MRARVRLQRAVMSNEKAKDGGMARMQLLPAWLRDLAGAWVFYSVLPAWPGIEPGFGRIARFAPWVAVVLGGLQGLLWLLTAAWLPPLVQVCLVIVLGLVLSGGLHADGVVDTADGLAAGPRALEAMDDSRVGAAGGRNAHDDGLYSLIVDGVIDGFGHIIGKDGLVIGKGILTTAAAIDDRPFGMDHGKGRLGLFGGAICDDGTLSSRAIVVELFELGILTRRLEGHHLRLMEVTQTVD